MPEPIKDLEDQIARWIPPELRARSAYAVPDASGYVKLDAMENPYPLPDSLVSSWLDALRDVPLNRYPDPSARRLKARLREVMDLPQEAGLVLGNGSDELIQLVVMALRGPGRVVLAPEPTFVMYRLSALAVGFEYVGVPLDRRGFDLPLDALLAEVQRHQPAAIFLAHPNNPTGTLYSAEAVCAVVANAPGLVVVDEAYAPFAQASLLPQLLRYPNLLVMRTLSKLGLAGLRLGLLAGRREWLEEIDKLRLPYNVNALTQASADFALGHYATFEEQAARIRADRDALYVELAALGGVEVWPSRANFLLFRVPKGRAGAVDAGLRARGVLVKNLHGASPMLADCLRVTIGTPHENRAFLDALKAVLEEI
ncbi:MAG: histidinol-phosphate transaminase [Gammaproteobacteria bacterium]|nr:histidinol-phosphate transaminase [Gammaproteobacteria bacterium]NIR82285.1 histidinol-phosphate transaminase [Gammaproteobacteria bacterium]NIR91216.1 histidinol-phosphate transaminase [Gammaproteobacteria bacterium]NIU03434.1 histidinol-phosphate transaminase [Gammaproteobacteria bacterium]NIX84709.1 histidinol-phosphate transaminase [Gammaproteobacteria bacterium]